MDMGQVRKGASTYTLLEILVEPNLVKFLSSFNDSELYWSYAMAIFPPSKASQGVSVRMLQRLDGAR